MERLGVDACSDDELLAVALAGAGARPLARRMIDHFGGLAGLVAATADAASLTGDAAIGSARAAQVAAIVELGRRAAVAWPTPAWLVRTPADIAERLMPGLGRLEREELHVLTLNTKNAVTAGERVYAGNLAGSSVRVGEVFRTAVRRQAAAIVVAHNHPSGDPAPSAEDLRITAELAQAGRLLDIELLDHLVIGHGRWISLRALGAF
jgi:DNA repair protein RadC